MANISMTYGSYAFSPVPQVEISKEIVRTGDESPIQEQTTIRLSGTIVASDYLQSGQGLYLLKPRMDLLRDAFKDDCLLFLVKCDGNDIIRARPKVITPPSFAPTNNNWVATTEYTIELRFTVEVGENSDYAANVRSVNESWQLEFDDNHNQYSETIDTGLDASPYVLRLTHTLSAQGIATCNSGLTSGTGAFYKPGWQEARDWVVPRLGYDSGVVISGASGVFNISSTVLGLYNHMRTNSLDEVNGNFEATESWIVVNTGQSGIPYTGALEDFTVSLSTSAQSPVANIRIEGNIQGLEARTYGSSPGGFSVTTDKYANALAYWNVVKSRLYARAKKVYSGQSLNRTLNTQALSFSQGHGKSKGTISYSYEYDDRVCFLLGTGALSGNVLSEIITVGDSNPTDVFAVIPVLGRSNGPILQEISTISESQRTVSVEVLVKPPTGCSISSWNTYRDQVKSGVSDILCEFEGELTDAYSQVFKNEDKESWIPQQGRYTRNIGWTFANCSGTGNTSVC